MAVTRTMPSSWRPTPHAGPAGEAAAPTPLRTLAGYLHAQTGATSRWWQSRLSPSASTLPLLQLPLMRDGVVGLIAFEDRHGGGSFYPG